MPRRSTLETARAKAEEAALRRQAASDTLRAKVADRALKRIVALESRIDPAEANNVRRRTAKIETKPEDTQRTTAQLAKAVNVGRELHRTSSRMRIFEHAFSVNVVGQGPKVVFHWQDRDAASRVADWFNGVWAAACDARDDNHLADFCDMVVSAVPREGEVLAVFDDFAMADGKLTFYEADQLPDLDEKQWAEYARLPANQNRYVEMERNAAGNMVPIRDANGQTIPLKLLSGRITNRYGRVLYYVADEQHGRTGVDPADHDVRILSRNVAKLIKRPWRFNQHIGQSELLALAGDLEDLDAMRAAEIASARKNSQRAYAVKGRNAFENALARAGVEVDAEIENAENDPALGTQTDANLNALELYADGHVDYIEPEEDIIELGANRPNMDVATFDDDVGGVAGGALGLARVYTTLKASTSYTAFRGEMLITWGTFAKCQKWLERRFLDWVCVKAVGFAVARGLLRGVTLPDGWENSFSWDFPAMPEVDELKAVTAKARKLKNGLTDFALLLGPDWRKRLAAFAEQLAYIRESLPELEVLETKAGAPAADQAAPPNDGDDE